MAITYSEYSISINGTTIPKLTKRTKKATPKGEIGHTAGGITRVDRLGGQLKYDLSLQTVPLTRDEIDTLINFIENIQLGVVSLNSSFNDSAKNYIFTSYEVVTDKNDSYFEGTTGHNDTQRLVLNLVSRGD